MKNQLSHSSSLYLRQHAGNPVHWQPWGNEALNLAAASGKLLIISIGYAACHWCHVMEHESFSDPEVADLMNRNFVCIKIDREERPDLDQQYMDAAHTITGRGGWPLNCIALPDGKPVYAGTYFRKSDWINVLSRISLMWEKDAARVKTVAAEIAKEVQTDLHTVEPVVEKHWSKGDFIRITGKVVSVCDQTFGGLRGAPKFPMPAVTDLLLSAGRFLVEPDAANTGLNTLSQMANGGIYDHIDGGFARYSTDSEWKVPHFEKMLYDNAQLLQLYAKAYVTTGNPAFRETAEGILGFLKNRMTSPKGLFYSSVDADSEGEEGLYYTWTTQEIEEVLGDDTVFFAGHFDFSEEGNFEKGRNILIRRFNNQDTNAEPDAPVSGEKLKACKQKMLAHRVQRVAPVTDPKVVTSWNAMMVSALVAMDGVYEPGKHLPEAEVLMQTLLDQGLTDTGELLHLCGNGDTRIEGFLEDYGAVLLALTDLFNATANPKWLSYAISLANIVLNDFSDANGTWFYFTSQNTPAPVSRKPDVSDNVVPSGNAMMAMALDRLAFYLNEQGYRQRAAKMLHAIRPQLEKHPWSYAHWVLAAMEHNGIFPEITLGGSSSAQWQPEIRKQLLPQIRINIVSDTESRPGEIIVCFEQACLSPFSDIGQAMEVLKQLCPAAFRQ